MAFVRCVTVSCERPLHVYKGDPVASGGPAIPESPVSAVLGVAIGAGAKAIFVVNGLHGKHNTDDLSRGQIEGQPAFLIVVCKVECAEGSVGRRRAGHNRTKSRSNEGIRERSRP